MRYYLTQDHFHYDDSGYYGYILFSGTNAELRDLLKALGRGEKPHGFGWHRWGRSFRPANNKVVYDFYIRLRSKTGTKPTQEEVDAFLRRTLPPRRTLSGELEQPRADSAVKPARATTEVESESDNPPIWADQFFSRMETTQLKAVDSFTQRMSEELLQLQSAIGEISDARQEINRLQANLEQTRAELAEKEADLEAKEGEIETLRDAPRAASYDKQMQEERDKAEKAASRLRDEIKHLRAEKNDQISGLKASIKEVERERDNWKELYEKMNQEAAETERRATNDTSQNDKRSGGKLRMEEFEGILDGISPNLVFVRGAVDILYKEVDDYRFVFETLCKIVYEQHYNGRNAIKGNKGKRPSKWREDRVGNNDWRIYFCKDRKEVGDKFVVFVNDKNSQDEDKAWMNRTPPSSLL